MLKNTEVALAISLGLLVGSVGVVQASGYEGYERSGYEGHERPGALPGIARDDDGSGSYYLETKTQLFESTNIREASESSAAKASTELSIEERYSGTLPSVTRDDYGLGSYYVESKPQPACTQYDLNPLSIIYPEQRDSVSFYLVPDLVPGASHIVCLRSAAHG